MRTQDISFSTSLATAALLLVAGQANAQLKLVGLDINPPSSLNPTGRQIAEITDYVGNNYPTADNTTPDGHLTVTPVTPAGGFDLNGFTGVEYVKGVYYAIQNDGDLFQYDPATDSTFQFVSTLPANPLVSFFGGGGLAYDDSTDTLYALRSYTKSQCLPPFGELLMEELRASVQLDIIDGLLDPSIAPGVCRFDAQRRSEVISIDLDAPGGPSVTSVFTTRLHATLLGFAVDDGKFYVVFDDGQREVLRLDENGELFIDRFGDVVIDVEQAEGIYELNPADGMHSLVVQWTDANSQSVITVPSQFGNGRVEEYGEGGFGLAAGFDVIDGVAYLATSRDAQFSATSTLYTVDLADTSPINILGNFYTDVTETVFSSPTSFGSDGMPVGSVNMAGLVVVPVTDLNDDTHADFFDIAAFQNDAAQGQPNADLNADNSVTKRDLDMFLGFFD